MPGMLAHGEASQELARSWRKLTRVATVVAVMTAPALFVWFSQQNDWPWWQALLASLGIVVVFRGFAELLFRKLIPWPSLFGVESEDLREEDVIGRRRAWFWRFWFKIAVLLVITTTVVWLFHGGTWLETPSYMWEQVKTILSSPTLWTQMVFVFFLFFANFAILFGPLLLMNLSQMQSFEPGDAEWGVKIADVRGQTEAKDEVSRVVDIWQSGEQFERAGGKRERGLLLFGAPGTGKTMLAKAIATGFNSPFISMPGSGFAATFIGIDAIIVRLLARKAKRLARKWGGQCIVFIDEIDAVGMRRQSLGAGAQVYTPLSNGLDTEDDLFFGPWGARNPSGDLIVETQAWRDRLFAQRSTSSYAPSGFYARFNQAVNWFMFPGGMGGMGGGLALNQLLVVMDGIDNPPFFRRHFTSTVNKTLDAMFIVASARRRPAPPHPGSPPAQGADLLHRRDQRPHRSARSGPDPPRSHGPPRLVPDADEGRPSRHPRPLHRQGLARRRPRLAEASRRDRTHHERLLARDDRAGDLDGADPRPPRRTDGVRLGRPRRGPDHAGRGNCHRLGARRHREARRRDSRGRPRRCRASLREGLRVRAPHDQEARGDRAVTTG